MVATALRPRPPLPAWALRGLPKARAALEPLAHGKRLPEVGRVRPRGGCWDL